MLPVKKIYIDSKFRTKDSVSSAHFKYDLPESFLMPENCGYYVCDVCIPHSWMTIEPGINDKFYIHTSDDNTNVNLRPNENYAIQLDSRQYTGAELALEISSKLAARLTGTAFAGGLTASYNASTQTISIITTYSNMTFIVLTADDIKTKRNGEWVGDNYNENDPCDINSDMLKQNIGNNGYSTFTLPFKSGYLNLQPIRNLYLHSSNIGGYHTIGLYGARTIIKKIPVSSDFNYLIIDNAMTGSDYVSCERITMKQLEFRLSQEDGKVVPLHGANISFSLVFGVMDTKS
jgi:hypothetical protein